MKKLIVIAGLMLSIAAQAYSNNPVFKSDTVLPSELQERILNYVEARCVGVDVMSLVELDTQVRDEYIDQGQVDAYFTTTFSVVGNESARIVVKSAEYSFSNGDNLEVSSAESSDFYCNN